MRFAITVALKNITEAIELCVEVRDERGLPLTVKRNP